MARTPLSARTVNVVPDVPSSKASAHATASRSQPRPSLLVQKLAERRQASNSPAIQRSRPIVTYTTTASGVDLPTPPATRSPDRTSSATRVTHRPDQRSPPPSPSPRRRAGGVANDENVQAEADSTIDSSMSLSADSSTSSMRRSSRNTKQAAGKGISPALAPLVQIGKESNSQRSTARRPANVRSGSAAPSTGPSTARRTTKRTTPSASDNPQPATTQPTTSATTLTGKRKAPSTGTGNASTRPARRPRTSLSQPLLTPPPSSSSHSLRPANPAPQRASSTQPYSTPQQHRLRIFDVTKRRTAATTATKRGVWRAGSLLSAGPDEHFNHSPIILRPESPTDDPILLKPTPKELEEERRLRQRQLQTLLDAENDRQGDDTFADVRARSTVNGSHGDITLPNLTSDSVGLGLAMPDGPRATTARTSSFAETGIDDISEEDEEDGRIDCDHSREDDEEEERSVRYDDHEDDGGVDFAFDPHDDDDAGYAFDASGEAHDDEDEGRWANRRDDDLDTRSPYAYPSAQEPSHDEGPPAEDAAPAEDTPVHDASMSFGQGMSHGSDEQHMRESTPHADRAGLMDGSTQSPVQEDPQDVEGGEVDGSDEDAAAAAKEWQEGTDEADDHIEEPHVSSAEIDTEDGAAQEPRQRPRFSDTRLPSVSPEVSDPLADSASFLLEEQMRFHSYHEDEEESENGQPLSEDGEEQQDGSHGERGSSEEQSNSGRSESQGSPPGDDREMSTHGPPKQEVDEHESLLHDRAADDAGEGVHANDAGTYDRLSYSLQSPHEQSYSRDTRADSILSMLYSDSGRDMSPFVGIQHASRHALPLHSTPLKMEAAGDASRGSSPDALQSHHSSISPAPARPSPSRSYSTLGPNSTRLAMHSLARSTSIVEVLSTDAQAAARAAALLRVHHNWIHEGNLISNEDEAGGEPITDRHASFHGDVLNADEHVDATAHPDETVLPDLLQDAESRLRANGAEWPSSQSQRRTNATPARRPPAPQSISAGPTPLAPGAYVFSPAGSPANLTLGAARGRGTPRASQVSTDRRKPLPDLASEVEQDPSMFSKAAWKGLDRAFRHVVREEAKGGRPFVKPGVMEMRHVVLALDPRIVVKEFLNGYGIDDRLLTRRWSASNLLKSVSALQRKFFQNLEREYPGCLTPAEAALADASIYGSEMSGVSGQQALSLPSISQADEDRESTASQMSSPFEAPSLQPELRPQTSTPLISREKRLRRLDVYIPSPSRREESLAVSDSPAPGMEPGRSISPAHNTAEDDLAESEAEEGDTTQRQEENVHESTPVPDKGGRSSSVLYEVGNALKRRLSQVFSRRAEESEEQDESDPRSASPADEVNLSNATTVLDEEQETTAGVVNGIALPSQDTSSDDVTVGQSGNKSLLYPALPPPSDITLERITPLPRVSLARERTDPAARLAARERMQRFRDESLEMRRRMQASSHEDEESMAPPLTIPIKRVLEQAAAEVPRSRPATRPRDSLLVSKLSERRSLANGNDSMSATHPRIRQLSKGQSAAKPISPLGKRRAEELEHERRKRQALREETMQGEVEADVSESFDDSILGAGSGLAQSAAVAGR